MISPHTHYTFTLTIYLGLTTLDRLAIKITPDTQFVSSKKGQSPV